MKKILLFLLCIFTLVTPLISSAWTNDLKDGLVSVYNFDENTGVWANDSLGNFNTTFTGANPPTWVTGKFNKALQFKSKTIGDSYLTMTPERNFTNTYTISFWLNYTDISLPTQDILQGTPTAGTNYPSNDRKSQWSDGKGVCNVTMNNNTWYNVIFQYDLATTTGKIWSNGALCNVTTIFIQAPPNQTKIFSRSSTYGLEGLMDNVMIWNRILNEGNISQIYNSGAGITYEGAGPTPEVSVYLSRPENNSQSNDDPLFFNVTIIPNTYNLTNATIYIWHDNGTLFNSTNNSLSGDIAVNTSWVIYNLIIDDYVWNVYGCQGNGNGTNCSFASNNYTFQWVPFEVDGEQYNANTFETKNETIYLNITTDATVSNLGAFLVYNGSNYAASHSCSGGLCQIYREIDIPLLVNQVNDNENKSFHWQITLFGSFGTFTSNTTANQQNISNIDFDNSVLAHQSVEYKIYNESTLGLILTDFDATFNYYLGTGSVSESKNYSLTGATTYNFYINRNETFKVNASIMVGNDTNSRTRDYFLLKEEYTNTTTTQPLYIPYTDMSNIIIEVKNQGLIPLSGNLIKVFRFYPDLNDYRMVESQLTDEFGQFVAKLIQNDAKYKFEFYNQDKVLLKTSDRITIACRNVFCVVPFVIETTDGDFDRYENLTLFSYDFEFDNTTNIFTLLWDDQKEENSRIRLEVWRTSFNQSEIVCNSTSITKVSSLTCSVGSQKAGYKAQVFRSINGGEEKRIALINVSVGSPFSSFGVEGLLWVFILLFTGLGIGAFNPVVGATFYGVGFIIFGIIGFISMPLTIFFANTLLVALFIWAIRT